MDTCMVPASTICAFPPQAAHRLAAQTYRTIRANLIPRHDGGHVPGTLRLEAL